MPAVLIATDIVKCPHTPGAAANVTASKLTVGTPAAPVLLGSLVATAAGSPGGSLSVKPGQSKLTAI